MSSDFYHVAKILDDIKNLQNPSDDQIDVVIQLISEEKYARYFFLNLENPIWVLPLYKKGFFHNAPEPVEVKQGSFQLPGWPAGEYLARFAGHYEDIVVDVVQSTNTENWRVQEILVDAMLKIPPAKATKLVTVVDSWLDSRFSDMLPNKLIRLADYLFENGLIEAAIQIFEYVIAPIIPPVLRGDSKYNSVIRFRSDHYWVNEYCKKQYPKLIEKKPINMVSVLKRQLEKTIELTSLIYQYDAEIQVGYYWRMDIPNQLTDESVTNSLDLLIEGLRDGLIEVCKQSVEEGRIIIQDYLNSEHIIFKRLALYTLRLFGQNYPELINQALLEREHFEKSQYTNDYRGLMRNQFNSASAEVRSQVISWILSGPSDVDLRANRYAQWENRDVTDDDRREVREDWILYNLEIIREFLTGEVLSRLDELTAIHGKPDIVEKPRITTTSWGGTPSPVLAEDLAQKSFEETKELFLTYVPDNLFLNPRESLAQTFQMLVSKTPTKYSNFASLLIDPGIRFVYIYHYLAGIREGIKNNNGLLTNEILMLCEYVLAVKEDSFLGSSGDLEPGLIAAQMEVAHVIEESLRSNDPYLERSQLDRIRSLLITLAHHPDPKFDADTSTSVDPFTQSLNCVRGQAMHGILHYSLYLTRQQENKTGQKLKEGFLEPEILKTLEEKLDISIEPSLAIHSVFGAFVPQLHYLSRKWLVQHLNLIFPENEEMSTYWKAAWDAYIFTSRVYIDVFNLLIPQYHLGLKLLTLPEDEQKHISGSPKEHLARHLMSAYLAELTDFGHENMLLDLFYENASDAIRAQGVFWISKVLQNEKPSSDSKLWKRCWSLWQMRLKLAETQEVSRNTQEISDYLRWLSNCPVGLEILYQTLVQSIKYLHDGFDSRQITEYAAKHCDQYPLEAVNLLQLTILQAKETWWSPDDEDEKRILQAAMNSTKEEAKRIAIEVINFRGEHGDFRWKHLLQ